MSVNETGQDEQNDMSQETAAEETPQVTDEETVEESKATVESETADETPVESETPEPETPAPLNAEPTEEVTEEPETATQAEEPQPERQKPRFRRGELLDGVITKNSPTEILVRIGEEDIEGLVPGRELERMTANNLEELQEGQEVKVFVVNPNDHQGNVILSINRAQEEMDWKTAEEFRAEQRIYEDSVAGYNKGGLIVRFGRLRGFVPQSQISDNRRRRAQGGTPEERYGGMVGEDIIVKVMEVDRGRNRLILSERAASRERRERRKAELIDELSVGQVKEGRVVSLEDFGAFVDVGGAEGLVHLTEISWRHVTHPRDVLKVGETVTVEVIGVDENRKRIGLSIKRQQADPWDAVATTYQVGDLVQGVVTKLTKFGAFARLVDAEEIEGLIHISELSDQRVNHPRDVVQEEEKLTLRVVKIDVKNRRLGLSLKAVNSAEYLDHDMQMYTPDDE